MGYYEDISLVVAVLGKKNGIQEQEQVIAARPVCSV
jgi:hypothetical protein